MVGLEKDIDSENITKKLYFGIYLNNYFVIRTFVVSSIQNVPKKSFVIMLANTDINFARQIAELILIRFCETYTNDVVKNSSFEYILQSSFKEMFDKIYLEKFSYKSHYALKSAVKCENIDYFSIFPLKQKPNNYNTLISKENNINIVKYGSLIPGTIAVHSDSQGHHKSIILESDLVAEEAFVLMITSNQFWNNFSREMSVEEKSLCNMAQVKKKSYFAPIIARKENLFALNIDLPLYRLQDLKKEFCKYNI